MASSFKIFLAEYQFHELDVQNYHVSFIVYCYIVLFVLCVVPAPVNVSKMLLCAKDLLFLLIRLLYELSISQSNATERHFCSQSTHTHIHLRFIFHKLKYKSSYTNHY